MKLNDYKCAVCGHIEVDCEAPPRCRQCKKKNPRKIAPLMWKHYRKTGIIYKGPGYTGAQKEER